MNADNNSKINNVSFIKNLQILYACANCGIDQNGINGLNLISLNADENEKINDASFMKNLRECTSTLSQSVARTLQILVAGGNCGIKQNGIAGLNLIELDAFDNKEIKNVEKKCRHFF